MKKLLIALLCVLCARGAYSDGTGFGASVDDFYSAYGQYMKGLINLDAARAICSKMFQIAESRSVDVVVKMKDGGSRLATSSVCEWDDIDSVIGLAGEAMLAVQAQCKSHVDLAANKKWEQGHVFSNEMFKRMANIEEVTIDDDTDAYDRYKSRISELRKKFTKKLKSDMSLNKSSYSSGHGYQSLSKTCNAGQTLEECSPELCDYYADVLAGDEYAAYFHYKLCGTSLRYVTNTYTQSLRENLLDDNSEVSESYKKMVDSLDSIGALSNKQNQVSVQNNKSDNQVRKQDHERAKDTEHCLVDVDSAVFDKWYKSDDSLPGWAKDMFREHASFETITVQDDTEMLSKYKGRVPILRKKFTKKLREDMTLTCNSMTRKCEAGKTLEECSPALCDCFADAFAYAEYSSYFEQELCGVLSERTNIRADVLDD